MTALVDPVAQPSTADVAVDGDAATYLEELVGDTEAAGQPPVSVDGLQVELVGPHLRLSGCVTLGRYRRLSDVLNHHEGLLKLHASTVLRRNGQPTRVTTDSIWVSPSEVTLIGQFAVDEWAEAPPEFRIVKKSQVLIVVTPGHTLTGEVYIPVGAELAAFIESADPQFIPMTDVRTRSLADRRIVARYPFALLNRRHIVAATEALPGMMSGRTVI